MSDIPDPLVVLSTLPNAEEAATIARQLVEEHLAACVNLVPGVRSIYRFDGPKGTTIQDETEVLAIIKTTRERYADLAQRLVELHPYDVPEVLAVPLLGGHLDYIEWIAANVRRS